ncbi:MAG: hypothetical protein AABZ63_05925 [Actinomycetota bacterium]
MSTMDPVIELIIYTDPYCTWCWGSEPVLRKIQEVYGDQVRLVYKMGGLVEDTSRFKDPLNKIGSGNAERAFRDDLEECRANEVTVSPVPVMNW